MRRVNLRYGLKQRINDIVGSDTAVDGDGIPGITEWSVQAAMLANLRRVVSALANGTVGRPVSGLWLTDAPAAGLGYSISDGFGFTPNGDIVVSKTAITYTVSDGGDDNKYIYLRHRMGVVDGDTYDDGKKTGFIGKAGLENIVYDDYAASKKDSVSSFASDIVIEESVPISNSDYVYLGYITVESGSITSVTNNPARGFGPNDGTGKVLMPGIRVAGESLFEDTVTFAEVISLNMALVDFESTGTATLKDVDVSGELAIGTTGKISVDGNDGIDANVIVRDEAGTGTKTLRFKGGIFYGTTVP